MSGLRSFLPALAAVLLMLGASSASRAAGTSAGTTIQGAAHVTYTFGSGPVESATSNTVTLRVAEILDAVVTVGANRTSGPGDRQQALLFTLTNTGNGTEAFALEALSAGLPGDDFDPQLAANALWFDTDNSNDLSAGDTLYVPGSNDPVLAADASVRVLVVNDIPAGVANGARGRTQLTASARSGTGAPGTIFAGKGDAGLDAIAGTTGGDGKAVGEYVVAGLSVSAVKSQSVVDPGGGARAVSGARISYRIVVSASGTGTAPAAVFSDAIPASTSYLPGSLQLNDTPLSDAADADAGELISAPAPQVRVQLGDLTQARGPQTIAFTVTIN